MVFARDTAALGPRSASAHASAAHVGQPCRTTAGHAITAPDRRVFPDREHGNAANGGGARNAVSPTHVCGSMCRGSSAVPKDGRNVVAGAVPVLASVRAGACARTATASRCCGLRTAVVTRGRRRTESRFGRRPRERDARAGVGGRRRSWFRRGCTAVIDCAPVRPATAGAPPSSRPL